MIVRKDGRVDAIGEPGTLLGVLPSPILADTDARLAVGDSLILYTDGVLDVRNADERGDPDWLADQLAAYAGKSADEIAEALAQATIKRHGGEPRDDIAILVLNRRGVG
jgi:serine phosphatase RsbU (regulator of sigma subunit)